MEKVNSLGLGSELEEIRKRKLLELRNQFNEEKRKEEQNRLLEQQRQTLMRRILTTKARERINRIKLVKPEFVEQLELQLIQIVQTGRIKIPINDEQLKTILVRLQPKRREFNIRRI